MRLSLLLSLSLVVGLSGCADEFMSDVSPEAASESDVISADTASLPGAEALSTTNEEKTKASLSGQCRLTLIGPDTVLPNDLDIFSISARNCDQITNLQWSVTGNATGQVRRPNRYNVRAGQLSGGSFYTVSVRVFFSSEDLTGSSTPADPAGSASKAASTTLTKQVYIYGPSDLGLTVSSSSSGFNVTWDSDPTLFCGTALWTCTLTTIYEVRGRSPELTSRSVSGVSFFDNAYVPSSSTAGSVRYRLEIDRNNGDLPAFEESQAFNAEEAGIIS
ncbi:MAG: hypothetical protein AAF791_10455 [Bacteroidota bacterium]